MSELPRPVSEVMRAPVGEAAISRMWRGVSERRAAARARSRPAWAVAALAAAVVLALAVWWSPRGGAGSAGPLRRADGTEIGQLAVAADAGAPRTIALSDGSSLVMWPGAAFTQLESTGQRFSALLGAGKIELAVAPGGPRHWVIECGLASVEVVGARFTIERAAAGQRDDGAEPPDEVLRVAVAEDGVLVRGERVPDRVRRLVAGESIEVRAHAPSADARPAAGSRDGVDSVPAPRDTAEPSARPAAPLGSAAAAAGSARASSTGWRELARRGAYADAYESLRERGIAGEAQGVGVDDLLALADVARLSGHPSEAIAPLRRVVDEHPGDARASLAAFTLGRLQLDSLGQPSAAAQSFAKALSLGIAGPLVEDARARLVEAHARAGNRDAARAAAEQYERQFPSGRHLAAVRRWVAD